MKTATARRFLVKFTTIEGDACEHRVATWMDSTKAVALAAHEHALTHKKRRLYRVEVEDLGELERDASGAYVLNDDDLSDRMEW